MAVRQRVNLKQKYLKLNKKLLIFFKRSPIKEQKKKEKLFGYSFYIIRVKERHNPKLKREYSLQDRLIYPRGWGMSLSFGGVLLTES